MRLPVIMARVPGAPKEAQPAARVALTCGDDFHSVDGQQHVQLYLITTMALFRRKNKNPESTTADHDAEPKEKVKWSKRPASTWNVGLDLLQTPRSSNND